MEVITVTNRKGGTGKSTTVLNLGRGLYIHGKRILFIDLDSQCSLTRNLGEIPDQIQYSIYEVMSGKVNAVRAIIDTEKGHLLAGSPLLALADRQFIEKGSEYLLKHAIGPITDRYDYILIDGGPALGTLCINALTASTGVLIVTDAKAGGMYGVMQLYDTIKSVRTHSNEDLQIKGILIARCNARTILSRDMKSNLQNIADHLNTKLFDTVIRENNPLSEAEAMHQDIFTYSPRSNGARDYKALTEEILQEGGRNGN